MEKVILLKSEIRGSNFLPQPWHSVDRGKPIDKSRPGHLKSPTGMVTLGLIFSRFFNLLKFSANSPGPETVNTL